MQMDQTRLISSLMNDIATASQLPPDKLLADDNTRSSVLNASRQLTNALEKPANAGFVVSLLPIQTLCVRLAIQMKLFHRLREGEEATSSRSLAAASGVEELLIIRVMRVLAGMSYVKEAGLNSYTATPISDTMTVPGVEACVIHCWDHSIKAFVEMIPFFEANGYQSPEDQSDGPIQRVYGQKLPIYDIWAQIPGVKDNFNTFMTGVRAARPIWLDWFPIQQEILDGAEQSTPLLVDIAGGRGHDLRAFRDRFPEFASHLILQDLHNVIKDNDAQEGIEQMVYDFFTPQPIHGARVYFFHFTLHNWPDKDVLQILRNTAIAMKKGYSKLLLNELALPDTNCPLFPAIMDIWMMGVHNGAERTEKQWKGLLQAAGLQLKRFWRPPGDGEGVVEAMLPD